MAERVSFPHRVFLEDLRRDGQYLRVTWHPERSAFVMSHWRDDVCVAATRIAATDAAELITLLANGLADAASAPPVPAAAPKRTRRDTVRDLLWRLRRRRPLAEVIALTGDPDPGASQTGEPRWGHRSPRA